VTSDPREEEVIGWDWDGPMESVAVVFLDHPTNPDMTVIAHRRSDGRLVGARDVTRNGKGHDDVIAAWIADAKDMVIEDRRRNAPASSPPKPPPS